MRNRVKRIQAIRGGNTEPLTPEELEYLKGRNIAPEDLKQRKGIVSLHPTEEEQRIVTGILSKLTNGGKHVILQKGYKP